MIETSNEELIKFIEEGYFFNFCAAYALNKGFKDAMKSKKEVVFTIGDYNVIFDPETASFKLTHKIYFARIIHAYYNEVVFIGDDEAEVINELLTEFKKEL